MVEQIKKQKTDKQFKVDKLLLILCLFLPLFFLNINKGSLFSFDEAWYAEISRNIIKDKNIFLLKWNNQPFLEQPPFGFWLMAVSYLILGISEFSTRFVSALLGFGSIILLYKIGARLFNKYVGFLSSLMLLSSVWFVVRARSGNIDIDLVFFALLSLFFGLKIEVKKKYLYLLATSFAMLLLVKYFIGLFLLPIIFYLIVKEKNKFNYKDLSLAFLLFLVIVLPFYLINYYYFGSGFLKRLSNIGTRGINQFKLNYQLPLFYLHMGVREWFYPAALAFIGNLFFIKKIEIRMVYLYIIGFFLPFLISTKTEIWHLIPLYPALGLLIFSFTDNLIKLFIKLINNNELKIKIKRLGYITLVTAGILLSLKQIKEFWSEVIESNLSITNEAKISMKAGEFNQPLFFTDLYFPTAIFYSEKEVNFIGLKSKFNGKDISSVRKLFNSLDSFILISTKDLLQNNDIKADEYEEILKIENKVLVKKKTT